MKEKNKVDVSIIYVNYNTTKLLIDSIKSVLELSSGFTYEIIVVDNASLISPEKELKKEIDFPFQYIQLEKNIGFGCGNNEAIRIAKGKHIFLLNTDTYLLNNAIYILHEYLNNHPEVGSCGGNLYDENHRLTYSYHRPSSGFRADILFVLTFGISSKFIKYPRFNPSNKPISVGNISGANLMIPRKVLDEVGSFNPNFFMYLEETELSWRIKKAGYKNMNVPAAHIVHLEGKSLSSSDQKIKLIAQSQKLYFTLKRGFLYYHLCMWFYLYGLLLHVLVAFVLRKKDIYRAYKQRFRVNFSSYIHQLKSR